MAKSYESLDSSVFDWIISLGFMRGLEKSAIWLNAAARGALELGVPCFL